MQKEKNILMLIGDVNKIFFKKVKEISEEKNIPSAYRPIIFHLAHHDGLTQLDLVKLTRFKAPTISLTLQKMEQEGYVIRKTSEVDARKTLVYLTDEGRVLDNEFKEILKSLENRILPKLDVKEKEELERSLRHLIQIMCAEFGEFNEEDN